MLFGDEDKDNSTAVPWDYEAETEPVNTELNTTNEKDLLDVINDSLKYIDPSKQSAEKQTNVPNQIHQPIQNLPSYNISNDGDDDDEADAADDEDDDDDEEISLLDFFLKGDTALLSTTPKPFVFNVTGKPLLNGMTNSPMQIQPILPDDMKNESIKFSMLPMSLYNMVKEDGSLIFEGEQQNQTRETTLRPLFLAELKHANHEIQSEQISTQKSEITSVSQANTDLKITTHAPNKSVEKTTTVKNIIEVSTKVPKIKLENNVPKSNQSVNVNKTESVSIKNVVKEIESTTRKVIEPSTKNRVITTAKPKTTTIKTPTSTMAKNVTNFSSATTEKNKITTKKEPSKKITNTPKIIPTTTARSTTIKIASSESTTVSLQLLTTTTTTTTSRTTTTSLPKITAVQIKSNPSILETDLSYDYSDQTLPPSLPNLKIIPFLPTDAVKNIIHQNDGYKSNYNYYQSDSNTNTYANHQEVIVDNTANSPFNIKPDGEKYPPFNQNVAEDRIDFDTYKVPTHSASDSLDYINVYAISGSGGVSHKPSSFQLSVNSKLDYGAPDQKVPSTVNKNLTVKPPLPPFEPEHEYDSYNLPPKPQHQLASSYNEYSVNGPNLNDPYSPEHNYNVPHFVTMPPFKEPPHRPINNKDSPFSYGHKNKFIPPAKTEGKLYSIYL